MGNINKYVFLLVGLMLLFTAAGIDTPSSNILNFLGINFFDGTENIGLGKFFQGTTGIFTGIAVAGAVALGLTLGRQDPVTFLLVGYAAVLLTFILDLTSIITTSLSNGSWEGYIVAMIGLPIVGGYIHSVVSWWAGK